MHPRTHSLAAAVAVAAVAASALAQPIAAEFVHGRDYTFERMIATREVRDAQDSGTIRLMAYVWRPLKHDRREVVLFSHGSTGGLATSPREPSPGSFPPPQLVRHFVTRGYTVVAPLRRGRLESTGTYVEECSVFVGECTVDGMVAVGERALREALLDTYAVVDQLVLGRLAPRDGRILAAGHSRGGFLSLLLAGERPQLVKGVVNFAGGWLGVTDRLSADQNERRLREQRERLAHAAKRTAVPTVWIYAARDPFYREGVPQALVDAWREGGGRAEFVYVAEHALENPHAIPAALALWARPVDDFLRTLDTPRP